MEPTRGYLVWRLSTKWRVRRRAPWRRWASRSAQYALLASLFGMHRAGMRPSQRELADTTALEPLYVSKMARALESDG